MVSEYYVLNNSDSIQTGDEYSSREETWHQFFRTSYWIGRTVEALKHTVPWALKVRRIQHQVNFLDGF
jgi:hypothetical protein